MAMVIMGKLDSTSTVRSVGSHDYGARLQIWEQAARSLLYMLQFGVGYFVMLLAMYYNGGLHPSLSIS